MIHIVVWVSLLLSVLNWVLFAVIAFSRSANGHAPAPGPAEGGAGAPAVAPVRSGAATSAAMLSIFCLLVALVAAGVNGA